MLTKLLGINWWRESEILDDQIRSKMFRQLRKDLPNNIADMIDEQIVGPNNHHATIVGLIRHSAKY